MNNGERVKLIVDVTILCNGKVLLVKYKDKNKYDHQRGWFLPDDLVKQSESTEDTACRIFKEQLGIREITSPVLDHIETFTGNDKTRHEVSHFLSELNVIPDTHISDDIQEEKWFNVDELPDEKEIAHHGWAKYTIEKILTDLDDEEE